jgi:hypothetical protein
VEASAAAGDNGAVFFGFIFGQVRNNERIYTTLPAPLFQDLQDLRGLGLPPWLRQPASCSAGAPQTQMRTVCKCCKLCAINHDGDRADAA